MTYAFIISLCLNFLSIAFCVYFFKTHKEDKAEILKLSETTVRLKNNILELQEYTKNINAIKTEREKTNTKIKGASNEEAENIISDIIDFNNSRMRDNKKRG